jgi:hypothetical protein
MHTKIQIEEPVFVFLTAFVTPGFQNHLAGFGVTNIFEKPMQ